MSGEGHQDNNDWELIAPDDTHALVDSSMVSQGEEEEDFEFVTVPEVRAVPTFAEIVAIKPVFQQGSELSTRRLHKRRRRFGLSLRNNNPNQKKSIYEPEPGYMLKVRRKYDPSKPKNAKSRIAK